MTTTVYDSIDYMESFRDYYGYPQEPDDRFFEKLTGGLYSFAAQGKYHMTYKDMESQLRLSYSYLTKNVPRYVKNGSILCFASKNKATEFVIPTYEEFYYKQKQKLNKPLAEYEFSDVIDYNIYVERLQLRLITSNNIVNEDLFNTWSRPNDYPKIIAFIHNKKHHFKAIYYKNSGKLNIHINFNKNPIIATSKMLSSLFDYLMSRLLKNQDNKDSFVISQFVGYIRPFKERKKQKININKSSNLTDLLQYLSKF